MHRYMYVCVDIYIYIYIYIYDMYGLQLLDLSEADLLYCREFKDVVFEDVVFAN